MKILIRSIQSARMRMNFLRSFTIVSLHGTQPALSRTTVGHATSALRIPSCSVCMLIGHCKKYENACCARKFGPYGTRGRQQWWETATDVASAIVLSFPPRSFFRHSRPALAWQSEQIGQLNLSELQRRVSAGSCHTGAISPPPRYHQHQTELARVVRKTENRHGAHRCIEWTNERTLVPHALCYASMRA